MKIKSEKQSSKLCEPSVERYSGPMRFDPEKYRKYLPKTDWSKKAQDEYLNTVGNMMSALVDLAAGTDSVQAVSKTESPFFARKLSACGPKDFEPAQRP
jgi:hypothetical protein